VAELEGVSEEEGVPVPVEVPVKEADEVQVPDPD
jgi:hypothetical protein